jgi:hypothetical protein
MEIPRHPIAAAAVLVALLSPGTTGAQQVERVEAKFTVNGSSVPGIVEGQVIRIDAEDPSTKLAFPSFERVKLFGTTLDIQSSFFVVRGKVGSSSIGGIAPNATLECRFNFATVTCSVSEGSGDTPSIFGGTVLRLHVVEQ